MRLSWDISGDYEETGGRSVLREAVEEALDTLPREHLRKLDALVLRDDDPRGKSLGVWRQDHHGCTIELYINPHVTALLLLSASIRDFALRLHVAYTLFHEVGHHVTRVLNPRAAPPRKAARVNEKIERWADEYAEKRLQKLCNRWLFPEGRANGPEAQKALIQALRALRQDDKIKLPAEEGTKTVSASSSRRDDCPRTMPAGEPPLT